jgi:hypothetical protein
MPEPDHARGTICAVYEGGMMRAGIVASCAEAQAANGDDIWTIVLEGGEVVQHLATWCLVFDAEREDELRRALAEAS